MLPMLVEALPSYENDWRRFKTEYTDNPEPFLYVALAQFSTCLAGAVAAGDGDGVARVFKVLERFITEGDHDVQEAAVVGLIKNLQNAEFHRTTAPQDYEPFLLPETRRWWEKVKTFWINGRLLTKD
jgi:hypothetical protein